MEELKCTIRNLICEELKIGPDQVTPNAKLKELPGIESVKVLRIVAKVEQKYNIELDDNLVFRVTTIEELAQVVKNLIPDKKEGT